MISLKDTESLTAFKRDTAKYIKKIKKSGNPLVLTINGMAKLVVQDVESYQRILNMLDRAETIEAIREGLKSIRHGRIVSLSEFDKEMRKKMRY